MRKRETFSFIATFLVSFGIIYTVMNWVLENHEQKLAQETKVLHEGLHQQFKLGLAPALTVGLAVADYAQKYDDITKFDYKRLGASLVKRFDFILGLNVHDSQGVTVRVFPEEENRAVLNKLSRNYPSMLASAKRNEEYWFSPPFELRQGGSGYAFYIPVYHGERLIGWISPVLRSEKTFKTGRFTSFLKHHELIIQDRDTGLHYMASSSMPKKGQTVYTFDTTLFGRNLRFISWNNRKEGLIKLPLLVTFLISLILSILFDYIMKLFIDRRNIKEQLKRVDDLLTLTTNEASQSLLDINRELIFVGRDSEYIPTRKVISHITYTTYLIEQVKILKEMAESKSSIPYPLTFIRPLIEEQVQFRKPLIDEKEAKVHIGSDDFNHAQVRFNSWLLSHGILGNVLQDCLLHLGRTGNIKTSYESDTQFHKVIFQSPLQKEGDSLGLSIADKVIHLAGGYLTVAGDIGQTRAVTLYFPK